MRERDARMSARSDPRPLAAVCGRPRRPRGHACTLAPVQASFCRRARGAGSDSSGLLLTRPWRGRRRGPDGGRHSRLDAAALACAAQRRRCGVAAACGGVHTRRRRLGGSRAALRCAALLRMCCHACGIQPPALLLSHAAAALLAQEPRRWRGPAGTATRAWRPRCCRLELTRSPRTNSTAPRATGCVASLLHALAVCLRMACRRRC